MITAIECTETDEQRAGLLAACESPAVSIFATLQSRALFLIEVYGPLGWLIFDRDLSNDDRWIVERHLKFDRLRQSVEKCNAAIMAGMLPAIKQTTLAFGEFGRQAAKMNQGREGR